MSYIGQPDNVDKFAKHTIKAIDEQFDIVVSDLKLAYKKGLEVVALKFYDDGFDGVVGIGVVEKLRRKGYRIMFDKHYKNHYYYDVPLRKNTALLEE